MKKGIIFWAIFAVVLVVSNDSFLVMIGLKEPPVKPLSAEEKVAITRELDSVELEPLLLEKVTLESIADAEPMNDARLVFHFNRPLTELESRGLGSRGFFKQPWHYSIGVQGKHELAEFIPINTHPVQQDDYQKGSLEIAFDESTLHPKLFRKPREFAEYANATFKPGGIKDFQFLLFRWQGYAGETSKTENLRVVAEWNLSDMQQASETEWVVPGNLDPSPSLETEEFYEQEMNLPSPL